MAKFTGTINLKQTANTMADKRDGMALARALERLYARQGNCALNAAGVAKGSSTKTKLKISNTVTALVKNQLVQKTTAEVKITPTTALPYHNYLAVGVDLAIDGTLTATASAASSTLAGVTLPALDSEQARLGYAIIYSTNSGVSVGSGGVNLTSGAVTVTVFDAIGPTADMTLKAGSIIS